MRVQPLSIENAKIGFKNFSGKEGPFNRNGDRSFAVFVDHDVAEQLLAEGWNVKFPKPNDSINPEEDSREPFITVGVSVDMYPANVFIISNGIPTKLEKDEISMLDWAEIETIDLVIRPYQWEMNGKTGVKAYLKSGYFTIVTDKFASKYGI